VDLNADAIICGVRHHGETGVIVRALTHSHGLMAGYVRGGRSRQLRPVLMPGNRIVGHWRARTDTQLPALTADLLETRAPLLAEPLAAAAIDWTCALTVAALPEEQPYPELSMALSALHDAIALSSAASGWAGALVHYELLVLARLGFGLTLDRCVVSGAVDDLAFVSPRSAGAVSALSARGYEGRLLPLPAFIRDGSRAGVADALEGLALSGHFIEHRLFERRRPALFSARDRLITRLEQIIA
jgi:DNA repair protein RecO (recombination protein O)